MKVATGAAAVAMAVAQPALADKPDNAAGDRPVALEPLPADFDLAEMPDNGASRVDRRTVAPRAPQAPPGIDLREISWDPPGGEVEFENGAVLLVGALGAERKGLPKLAHIALDWDF